MRIFLFCSAALVTANLFACTSAAPTEVEASIPASVPAPVPEAVIAAPQPAPQPSEVSVVVAEPTPAPAPIIMEDGVRVVDSVPVEPVTSDPLPTIVASNERVPTSQPQTAQAVGLPRDQRFANWKTDFINRMSTRYDPAVVRSVVGPAELQDHLLDKDTTQPEFSRPVWAYLDSALKDSRVGPGRESLSVYGDILRDISTRYNVEPEYLVAIWGMESQYGSIMGDHKVVDALATFAFEGRRSEMFTTQMEALVQLVSEGRVKPEQLLGSWAGAMGMTQFMPATMRDYAVDFDRNGNIDLRGSEADALGSAAHYLSRFGWVPGQPAMVEVRLPDGFDYGLADGSTKRTAEDWAALGVQPLTPSTTGTIYAPNVAFAEGKLLLPAGAKGPAFLTLKNFDVIKRYNNSTSYAMAITGLAQTFQGTTPVRKSWPREDEPISFEDKKAMQEQLTALGYTTGGVDGQIGPMTRKAIRSWQRANSLPADGYVEQSTFRRIMGR